jgi:hypothetical protein
VVTFPVSSGGAAGRRWYSTGRRSTSVGAIPAAQHVHADQRGTNDNHHEDLDDSAGAEQRHGECRDDSARHRNREQKLSETHQVLRVGTQQPEIDVAVSGDEIGA